MRLRFFSHVSLLLASVLGAAPPVLADYPLASHRYLADPASLVQGGRVYLYASNDDDNEGDDGYEMRSLVCISSSDMKNWTDHGEVLRVPADASWASFSWAPALVERGGTIYLYFGNNANGIGVATSTTPTGRFTDPRGSALVTSSTPGASGTDSWLFDPSILVDDDGQAYLTFGGNGDDNARIIRLNSDMTSVSGSAIALSIPTFFEASWLHKRNDVYYLSFSTNSAAGLRIDYLTSSSPTSGYSYRGIVADQPPSNNNNNHAAIFVFNDQWYHAYHNRIVSTQAGEPTTYRRSLAIETLEYESDGAIQEVTYTTDGVPQLANLDPYVRVEAETTNAQSGIETEPCSEGGMDVTSLQDGDWIRVRGVDFGAGAESFTARVASAAAGGSIELRLGTATGTLVGTCAVPSTGGPQMWADATCTVTGATGVADLYLVFTGSASPLFNVNHWQFTGQGGGMGGAAGGGGAAGASGMSGTGAAAGGVTTGGAGGLGGAGAGGGGMSTGGGGGASAVGGAASGSPGAGGSGGAMSAGAGGAVSAGAPGTGGAPGGAGPGGGGLAGAGTGRPATSGEEGGCGCRVPSSSSPAGARGWLVALAAALAARRRRRTVQTR